MNVRWLSRWQTDYRLSSQIVIQKSFQVAVLLQFRQVQYRQIVAVYNFTVDVGVFDFNVLVVLVLGPRLDIALRKDVVDDGGDGK